MKYLYLVLSKTSTLTGRIIRFYTKETVNHSAISLTEDLTQMYTFARKRACNCIDGGLVLESPNTLRFGGKYECYIEVYRIPVTQQQYQLAIEYINSIKYEPDCYMYNTLQLFTRIFNKRKNIYKSFVCTEFSTSLLQYIGYNFSEDFLNYLTPGHMAEYFSDFLFYEGNVLNYPPVKSTHYNDKIFFTSFGTLYEFLYAAKYLAKLIKRAAHSS